jgi:hypothetical protein
MSWFYDKAVDKMMKGELSLTTHTIKALLVDTALYTADQVNDEFLADIAAGARVATSAALAGTTVSARVFDATDTLFDAVPTGDPCEALVLFRDTGDPATSPLVIYVDAFISGMPVTPNGGDIPITWANTGTKIGKL